jgi:signal transduction histidine kinase
MRTLQYRIALIITGAIIAVMLVATLVTTWVVSSGDAARMAEPMAQHISFSAEFLVNGTRPDGPHWPPPGEMAGAGPHPPGGFGDFPGGGPGEHDPHPPHHEEVANTPAPGTPRADFTATLKAALLKQHETGDVMVTEDPQTGALVASYKLANGRWGRFDYPRPLGPPPPLVVAVAAWMGLVVAGVITVALIMARRVTQPFGILESAVRSVGTDGVLPQIKETGSREARHTASVLNQLSERLRISMESRMRLVAAAGHDLRTPMTRMRLRAEFLPEEDREAWFADLDELEEIADSAIRLVREGGAGEDQIGVALDQLLQDTVSELAAANLPARLLRAEPGMVRAAPLSLRRALRNLITNAATHGGGATVALEASDQSMKLIIDDNGPGIPPDLMTFVFEPFFRVDPGRSKRISGAGLGLAIAKEIIERCGGAIAIENRPEGGLRQTVLLPSARLLQAG